MNRRVRSKLLALVMLSTAVALTSCSNALVNGPYEPIATPLETTRQFKSTADEGVAPTASPLTASTDHDVVLKDGYGCEWFLTSTGTQSGLTIYDGTWIDRFSGKEFDAIAMYDDAKDVLVLCGFWEDGDTFCKYLRRTANPSVFAGIEDWVRDTATYRRNARATITQGSIP